MKTEAQILGEAILKDRLKSEKSQYELAKEVGVTQQAFSGWEAGTSMPRHARLSLLASVFGEDSATVAAIKELFPKNWNNRLSEVFGRPSIATVLKMTADEHAAFAEKQRRQLNARAGRDDRHGFIEPPQEYLHEPLNTTLRLEQQPAKFNAQSAEQINLEAFRDVHDALSRAADDVRFARQALDRTAEQIDRALTKLLKH